MARFIVKGGTKAVYRQLSEYFWQDTAVATCSNVVLTECCRPYPPLLRYCNQQSIFSDPGSTHTARETSHTVAEVFICPSLTPNTLAISTAAVHRIIASQLFWWAA